MEINHKIKDDSLANYKARIEDAIAEILQTGQIDGSHHKMDTIDSVLRILAKDEYDRIIDEYQGETYEDGSREYEWDCGIPA